MSLLRRVRAEWAGALRSVRYDMGRRPVEPPSGGPDMTSTGMNTFGGLIGGGAATGTPRTRMPRRAALVTALGVLTVVGAAGAYLGVVDGLGSMLNDLPGGGGHGPVAAGATLPELGDRRRPDKTKNPVNPAAAPADAARPPGAVDRRRTGRADPAATAAKAARPKRESDSDDKSDKGRNAAAGPRSRRRPIRRARPEPSDSAYPSTSADPSPSETSATPGDSAEPSDSPQARHRRWHH